MNQPGEGLKPRSTAFPAVTPGLLRCLLAFTVVIHHMSSLALGAWAVNVFFVLSGYWVTIMYRGKYLRYRRPVLAFYLSRYLRLVPVLVFCQLCMLALFYFTDRQALSIVTPLWIVRSLLIAGSAHQQVVLIPAWSIDVEAQFYLAIPLTLLLLSRFDDRIASRIAWIAALVLLPLGLYASVPDQPWLSSYISCFLVGVAQAYHPWRPQWRTSNASLAAFVLAIFVTIAVPFTRGLLIGGAHPFDPHLLIHNAQFSVCLTALFLPFLFYSLSLRRRRATGASATWPTLSTYFIGSARSPSSPRSIWRRPGSRA
jgi:peptidoglycan/LPS O-acetylase OafA/YrhL